MGEADTPTGRDGLPQAPMLYGTLPKQLQDPRSFASHVARLIRARKAYRIAEATVVDVPSLASSAVCVLVMTLPAELGGVAVTAVNYGNTDTQLKLSVRAAAPAGAPRDVITESNVGRFDGKELELPLSARAGRTVVLGARPQSK